MKIFLRLDAALKEVLQIIVHDPIPRAVFIGQVETTRQSPGTDIQNLEFLNPLYLDLSFSSTGMVARRPIVISGSNSCPVPPD